MNHSVRWWVMTLGTAALIAIVTLAAVTYRNTIVGRTSEQAVAKSEKIRGLLSRLLLTLEDAETGQRGYLLTGEESYLEPYRDSLSRTRAISATLKEAFVQREKQSTRIEQIEKLAHEKHQFMARMIQLRRADEQQRGFEEARELMLTDRGRQLMADIRALVDQIVADEELLLNERLKAAERRAATTAWSIVVGNLLTFALVGAAVAAMRFDRGKRREAEQGMLTQEKRLDAIVDAAMMGIIACDAQQRIVVVNPSAEVAHGRQESELLGTPLVDLVSPSQRGLVEEDFAMLDREGVTRRYFHKRLGLRADGAEFAAEGSITKSIIDGKPLYTILFRDLTEREENRARIRQQEAVLDQIRDAVYLRDPQGRITYWNRGAALLYGWTPEQAIGQCPAELMSPDRLPELDEAARTLEETGAWSGELKQVTREGKEVIVEQRRTLLRDEDWVATGQLVISVDITQRKQAELRERRAQRLESVGTLAGGIAHDLNNVLTPIMMGAKLLGREQPPTSRQQLLETIHASAQRGAEMIKQLLAFAGGGTASRHSVDISRVIQEVQAILRHTLPKNITLDIDCPSDLWSVEGDSTELAQVLMNLAINARDAMPAAGVLSFVAENVRLNGARPTAARGLPSGPYVCLSVSDTGHGIPREIVERVFDPFFTTKDQGKGTGLGLSTSLGIVRSLGGSMSVDSEPSQGATFTIFLPARQNGQQAADQSDRDATPMGQGERVLVVDDESLILEMVRATLEASGYQALVANGGAEAVALFRTEHENLAAVVVDMMMPDLDGQATIDALRQVDRDVPIIASSGLRRPDSGEHRIRNAQAFLPKPYSDEQLLRVLRQAIEPERLATSSTGSRSMQQR